MGTYYRYFKAGGSYFLLAIVLVVFLMGEVYVWVWVGGGRRERVCEKHIVFLPCRQA